MTVKANPTDDACPYEWAEANLVPELAVGRPGLSPFAIRYLRARQALIEAALASQPERLRAVFRGLRLVTGAGFFRR